MSNKRSNFPNAQAVAVEAGETALMVERMEELRSWTPVREAEQVEQRVREFFEWCIRNDLKPGVELLALSLGTSRQTLWNWQREGSARGKIIDRAKQLIASMLEQWGLNNSLNVAAFCFLMKNNFGYSDSISIDTTPHSSGIPSQTAAEIAERHKAVLELPEPERPEL